MLFHISFESKHYLFSSQLSWKCRRQGRGQQQSPLWGRWQYSRLTYSGGSIPLVELMMYMAKVWIVLHGITSPDEKSPAALRPPWMPDRGNKAYCCCLYLQSWITPLEVNNVWLLGVRARQGFKLAFQNIIFILTLLFFHSAYSSYWVGMCNWKWHDDCENYMKRVMHVNEVGDVSVLHSNENREQIADTTLEVGFSIRLSVSSTINFHHLRPELSRGVVRRITSDLKRHFRFWLMTSVVNIYESPPRINPFCAYAQFTWPDEMAYNCEKYNMILCWNYSSQG